MQRKNAVSTCPRIERAWAIPQSDVTRIKPISHLLDEEFKDGDHRTFLYPFAPSYPWSLMPYAMEALRGMEDGSEPCVLFNPPTSFRQAERYIKTYGLKWDGATNWWADLKDEVARITIHDGVVISVSWDSNGLGAGRGFEMERILLVNHGGHWHDSIVKVERKTSDSEYFPDGRTLNMLEDGLDKLADLRPCGPDCPECGNALAAARAAAHSGDTKP
jgi:hypothetical protein